MKKALILTYYWPPSGGGGVQRWLKFVKYLRNFGWEPIVYTIENGEYPEIDKTLEKDIPELLTVLKKPAWEPYKWYKSIVGGKKQKISAAFVSEKKKPSILENFAVFVRGNFFIPDARIFWVKPSVKYLTRYLKHNPVDVIITTGPPHSVHLTGMKLKKRTGIKWIADFRDPWTNIDYYAELKTTKWADNRHHTLQRKVFQRSDAQIVVGRNMREEFLELGAKNVHVISNGFDEDDLPQNISDTDRKFSIAHVGTFMKNRNCPFLWETLSEIVKENDEFASDLVLKFVGKLDYSITNSIEKVGLGNYIRKTEYLPHNEIISFEQESQLLLLVVNNTGNAKGMLTGKFFEYLLAKRPILAIGPTDGDASAILQETNAGKAVNFGDKKTLKNLILEHYSAFKSGKLECNSQGIEAYSRKNLTKKLSELLDKITNQKNK